MKAILALWAREPARIVALVAALITLGVSFGLNITDQQTSAIMAVAVLLVGETIRTQVTPAP